MKIKIKDIDLKNCSFEDYKISLFSLNEDQEESSLELIKYYIRIRNINKLGTLEIYEDLLCTFDEKEEEIIHKSELYKLKKSIFYKNKSNNYIIAYLTKINENKNENLNDIYKKYYKDYENSLMYVIFENYLSQGKSLYINLYKNNIQKPLTPFLNFLYIHTLKKQYKIENLIKFIDLYCSEEKDMHILNLNINLLKLISKIDIEVLKNHLKNKTIIYNKKVSNLIDNSKNYQKNLIILSYLKNKEIKKEELDLINFNISKNEKRIINKLKLNKEVRIKKRI